MSNSNKTRDRHITASDYNFLQISLPCFKIQHKRTLNLVPLPTQKISFCKSSPADFFHGFYNTTSDSADK